ncbi:MAG TPA: radical SAM protein [candidate division WWE3 bacterium]|uniref:Radical SAM protein n=1 Tax=candidate division WWE3 bacterium TaxID=2053526 RepID=A0A7C1DI72_UNCKA|nr:radical SAM protein [candidate division WWE3 bacterium]
MNLHTGHKLEWVEFNPTMVCQAPLVKVQPDFRGKMTGCSYCYAADGMPHCLEEVPRFKQRELSTDQIFKLVDNMVKLKIPRISILGGEPQLREDFNEIISYICKNIPYVNLTTNGINSNSHRETLLKVHQIDISLDSHRVALGRKTRPIDVIKTALSTVDLLYKEHPFLCINAVVTPFTLDSLFEFIDWAFQERDIKKVNLYPIMDENLPALYLGEASVTTLIGDLQKKYKTYREVYCKAGRHVIVNYDGTIIPCAAFLGNSTPLGTSLEDSLNSTIMKTYRSYDFRSVAPQDPTRFESTNCPGKKLFDSNWIEPQVSPSSENTYTDKIYCMRCNQLHQLGNECIFCGFSEFDTKQLSMVCGSFSILNPKYFSK